MCHYTECKRYEEAPAGAWTLPGGTATRGVLVTQESLGQGASKRAPERDQASPEGSTRGIVVDERYAAVLAEDLGVDPELAVKAFGGEPRLRAMNVVGWAMDRSDDPEERGRMVLAWAQKRKAGAWSLRPRRYQRPKRDVEEMARSLALMWSERPELLAEALLKLEEATQNGGRR